MRHGRKQRRNGHSAKKTSVGSTKVLSLKYVFRCSSTQKLEAIMRKYTVPRLHTLGKVRLHPSPWLALLESCKLEIILVHVRNKD